MSHQNIIQRIEDTKNDITNIEIKIGENFPVEGDSIKDVVNNINQEIENIKDKIQQIEDNP